MLSSVILSVLIFSHFFNTCDGGRGKEEKQ